MRASTSVCLGCLAACFASTAQADPTTSTAQETPTKLTGEIRQNEVGGAHACWVGLRAEGANPGSSNDSGQFTLEFKRKPGEKVEIQLKHSDLVIISTDQTKRILPADPKDDPVLLVVARKDEQSKWADLYWGNWRKKVTPVIEKEFDRQVATLPPVAQSTPAQVEERKRAEEKRDQQTARAQLAAEQLAETIELPQEVQDALRGGAAADPKAPDLAAVSRLLEESDGNVGRFSRRFALGDLGARRWLVSGMLSASWLEERARPGFWVTLERLNPTESWLSAFAMTFEVGALLWNENASYVALPGTAPITYERKNTFLLADGGLRYYVPFKSARLYAGASIGFLSQPDYGWKEVGLALNGAAGVFLYPGSWRMGIELRASELQTRSREVSFDPYGTAQTDARQRFRPTVTLGFNLVPLSW